MREILFRGKRVDNGKWVYGLLCRVGDTYANIVRKDTGVLYSVLTNTIGQCTGLTDKNGRKIFEGDVLKICYDSPLFDGYDTECICYNGIVKYENALFVCEENSERGDALCALSSNEFDIIGNIHDNPELLEVTK